MSGSALPIDAPTPFIELSAAEALAFAAQCAAELANGLEELQHDPETIELDLRFAEDCAQRARAHRNRAAKCRRQLFEHQRRARIQAIRPRLARPATVRSVHGHSNQRAARSAVRSASPASASASSDGPSDPPSRSRLSLDRLLTAAQIRELADSSKRGGVR